MPPGVGGQLRCSLPLLSRVTFNIVVLKSTSCNRCSTSRDIKTQVELPTSFCWRERDISAGGQPEVVVSLKKLPYCRKAFNDQKDLWQELRREMRGCVDSKLNCPPDGWGDVLAQVNLRGAGSYDVLCCRSSRSIFCDGQDKGLRQDLPQIQIQLKT